MDHLILGLLLFQGRTIYEIKERIGGGLHLMYSASIGSMQAAIKKLLSQSCIECTETVEDGRLKKIYTITPQGREVFDRWVNAPFDAAPGRHPELLKVYFMGLSDKESRAERVQQYIIELQQIYEELHLIYQEGERMTPPEALQDIFRFQLLSLQFGIDMMRFQIDWYTDVYHKMKEGLL